MNIKVTFETTIQCDSEEQAFDAFLEYLSQVVRFEDLTAFNFDAEENV